MFSGLSPDSIWFPITMKILGMLYVSILIENVCIISLIPLGFLMEKDLFYDSKV